MLISLPFPRSSRVKVLYGGTELFDNEVRHTFHNDMMLAVISGACITVLVFVLTSFSGMTYSSLFCIYLLVIFGSIRALTGFFVLSWQCF